MALPPSSSSSLSSSSSSSSSENSYLPGERWESIFKRIIINIINFHTTIALPPSSSSSTTSSSTSTTLSTSSSSSESYLPDECWELIFKHISHPHDLESLSLVSRQLHSFVKRLITHLTISDRVLPLLPALLRRFPNLTSIKLTRNINADIDAILSQIASFDLPSLHFLDISHQHTFPSHGLRQFSQKFPTLKSLNCSHTKPDLALIAECFPDLEEIDVRYTLTSVPTFRVSHIEAPLASGLKKLRKVDLSGTYILQESSIFTFCQNCVSLEALLISDIGASAIANAIRQRPQLRSLSVKRCNVRWELIDALVSLRDLTCLDLPYSNISDEALCALADGVLSLTELSLQNCGEYGYVGISCLLRTCNNLQHLDLQGTQFLNDEYVIELSSLLGNLKVVKFSGNENLTDLSLFAIMRNCPLITEIRMDSTGVGKQKVEEDCLVVSSHLKFLYLSHNKWLDDGSVTMLASVCPNLEIIDLTYCKRVSEGAIDILCRCCKIQRMDLAYLGYDLPQFQFRVNLEVPTLSVLNLSRCRISDEELCLISKSCYKLKELNLDHCHQITNDRVKQMC
ncbi:hypothetical protein PIB30_069449 [Stylosanthes scabra]|uniref:F-box domain-containing protein n=1 Tax=Stylosanthes scabra TaxID=79078 RepID=A0ABU6QNV1_9FABA|nr:hypothetical protein [Stylosanthes scabra]